MKSHSVPYQHIVSLIQQVEPSFDTSGDFSVTVKVIGGVPHVEGSHRTSAPKGCYECLRYIELLEQREREAYPTVAEE